MTVATPAGQSANSTALVGEEEVLPGARADDVSGPGEGPASRGAVPGRRRRTVLWSCVVGGLVAAALVAVFASARPASQDGGSTPLLGSQGPSISGPGLGGGHFTLAQFSHQWVLVNFMATWCTDCVQEMPQLKLFYRQHARAGDATILAVEYDPADVANLRTYLRAHGAHWPAVQDAQATLAYGVQGLPTSFLVAPGGTVYAYMLGKVTAAQLNADIHRGAVAGLGRA